MKIYYMLFILACLIFFLCLFFYSEHQERKSWKRQENELDNLSNKELENYYNQVLHKDYGIWGFNTHYYIVKHCMRKRDLIKW
ncbi:MAG: hypothetical protein R3Y43_00985 [Alphaproteobacteria bacterium]